MKNVILYLTVILTFSHLKSNSQPSWTQKANYSGNARYAFAGFSANGKGFIGGGRYAGPMNSQSSWQQFDPVINSWITVSPMPDPYSGLSAFEVGGYGYISNGANDAFYDYETYKYNHLGNNWSTLASFPYPRLYATGTANGINGYIIGGYGNMAEPLRDFWEYNPIMDNWTELDTLPLSAARYDATSFSVNGNIYVFGGTNDIDYLNDLWKYDTSTNQWSVMSAMPAAGRQLCISFVLNDEAYIIGGNSNAGNLYEVWKYNTISDSWLQLMNFPGLNAPIGSVGFTINGKGYIVPANGTTECWEFDPGTVSVTEAAYDDIRLNVVPNPVTYTSILKVPAILTSPFHIEIYNSKGKKLSSFTSITPTIKINNSDYTKGLYILKIMDKNSFNAVTKFIVP